MGRQICMLLAALFSENMLGDDLEVCRGGVLIKRTLRHCAIIAALVEQQVFAAPAALLLPDRVQPMTWVNDLSPAWCRA